MVPPAFSLALQAPKHAQGQLVSTRQTENLALPLTFGQLVDQQNGLLHSWEMLGCQHLPPEQNEMQWNSLKLPWDTVPSCSAYRLLAASLSSLVQGTEEIFWYGVMRLFHLYFLKHLKPKALLFCASFSIPYQLSLGGWTQAGWIKDQGLGYQHRLVISVLSMLPNRQLYLDKHLQRKNWPGKAES